MSAPAPSSATLAKMLDAIASGLTVYVGTASSATSAWSKFCRQRFGALKPSRLDYTISEAL